MIEQWIRMEPGNITVHGRTYSIIPLLKRSNFCGPIFEVDLHGWGWFCFVFKGSYAGLILEDAQ